MDPFYYFQNILKHFENNEFRSKWISIILIFIYNYQIFLCHPNLIIKFQIEFIFA